MTEIVEPKNGIEVYINGDGSVSLLQTPQAGEDQIITIEEADAGNVANAITNCAAELKKEIQGLGLAAESGDWDVAGQHYERAKRLIAEQAAEEADDEMRRQFPR